jgi:hypothetical protein
MNKDTLVVAYKSMFSSPAWIDFTDKMGLRGTKASVNVLKTRDSLPRDFHFTAGQVDVLLNLQELAEHELRQLTGSSDKESE